MVFPRQAGLVASVVVVGICATLAAHAVASLTEAMYLAPSSRAGTSPLIIAAPAKQTRTRPDPAELVTRNMFCSTCTAPEPGPGDAFTPDAVLVATSIGLEPRASLRTPAVLGSFGIGDDVPGVGKVSRIGWTYVELVDGSGRHGRVTFEGAPAPPPPPTAAATDPWEGRLTRIDDHTFEVDRSLVRELVSGAAKPGAVRITPIPGENGQLAGLRFSGVREGSLPAALGIKNGDLVTEINGAKITSANVLLDVLAKLDQLNNVEVDGTRAGKPLGITLRLR